MKKIIVIMFAAAVITGALFYSRPAHAQFFMMENPLIGEVAPDFTRTTTSGAQKNMTDFRDGQNAIIFYWATWCPHCREQLKELNKQKADLEARGIKLILVDVGENAAQVQSYLKKNKIDMEVFLDTDSALSDEYALIGVPSFFFVNKEGIVLDVLHGLPESLDEIFGDV
ncbi:MAG: TlpA family protein disulfide reductase [Candidatus Omnitrophica bacterium]|nr:TlpA family protein disulfide reductase [Candidatus Omnitrophota bacterium]